MKKYLCPHCQKMVKSRFCPDCGTEINPPSDAVKSSAKTGKPRKKIQLPTGRIFWIAAVIVLAVIVILGLYGASVLFDYFTAGLTDLYLNGK